MAPPLIEYAVLPAGEGPGQDRCFTAEGLVVILDGASAIDPTANPDATQYVDTLGPLLVERITRMPCVDLRDALAEAIRRAADKLALVPGTAPSSTVSVVRWGRESVDVLVLGDSPVIVESTDGTLQTIVQHPQAHIAADLRQLYRERLTAGWGFDDEHRAILADIQRQESLMRNVEDGYWIAEADSYAARHADYVSISASTARRAILASDGAEKIAHRLATCSRTRDAEELRTLLVELDHWESEHDPWGTLEPRSKLHDDKALAVIDSRVRLADNS